MATYVRFLVRCRATHDFTAGDRERAGGLEDGAGVLEHVLQRRADGVGVDEHDLVDVLLDEAKGLLADLLHRHPVGEQADVRELDAPAGGERARHRIRILGLHADHLDLRPHALHVRGDAAHEPAAADGDEDRVDGPWYWRRISMPIVPCPAMTSGSS